MKRKIIIMLALLVLMLWGCGTEAVSEDRIKISLVETDGCTVENNGQWIVPGENAVFLLDMEFGFSLAGADYAGSYSTRLVDGRLELTLENVRYPSRVNLELTSRYSTITYVPNGGIGAETVKTHDTSNHKRPNTSIGTDLFFRDGYTLVSWNTAADGSGTRVGLGSRVSAGAKLTLYAQWMPWTDAEAFEYSVSESDTVTVTRYLGAAQTVVIPERIDGREVTAVASGAFENSTVRHIVFPTTMDVVEPDSFLNSSLETVTLFDNIQEISDSAFAGCDGLRTMYINAIEAPYGASYRKESCYADKVDLLINAGGEKKLVFYGGCSVWYNLDGDDASKAFGGEYTIINMGLNGTVNSAVQMQILGAYLEEGDIFLHTLELTSKTQLLSEAGMGENDDKLWCGIEYNYDLFTLVDLRTVDGVFDSLTAYLSMKKDQTTYQRVYLDEESQEYMDQYGCVPFYRSETSKSLPDMVRLDPEYLDPTGLERLEAYYAGYRQSGVRVYISYACVNMDAVPENQQGNVSLMDSLVKDAVGAMDGPVVISDLSDFLYVHEDFYDTNYHLLSRTAEDNTALWIRDLKAQMSRDGLWTDPET